MQTLKTYPDEKTPAAKKARPDINIAAFANIAEQYAREASFLWLLRSRAATSPLYVTTDMIDLEMRIEANLHGLSVTGELGWRICTEQLQYEEAGEIFTAAVVALRSRDATKIKMVCELALTSLEMTKGLISAFAWVETDIAKFWVQRFLTVTDPRYKYLGLAICSARREYPDKYLLSILQDPATAKQSRLHARGLRLIGELKRWELVPALNAAMESDTAEVKFWANWSAALLGNQAAVKNLKPWALECAELSDRAVMLVFSLLPVNEARTWIAEMAKNPQLHRLAIKAIGVLGDPQAVSWLIQMMGQPAHARIAGWAFCQITGIDLAKTNMTLEPADEIVSGPTDEPADTDVAMDEDEDLPWPDKIKVTRLWQVHTRLLQPGQRYFQGREITKQLLDHVYVNANQQQKELAVLQRAIHDRNTILVNIKARNI